MSTTNTSANQFAQVVLIRFEPNSNGEILTLWRDADGTLAQVTIHGLPQLLVGTNNHGLILGLMNGFTEKRFILAAQLRHGTTAYHPNDISDELKARIAPLYQDQRRHVASSATAS